jgi:Ca2+-binding EF-hand superfamily protein
MQFANENTATKNTNNKIEEYFQVIADRSGNGMVEASEFCAIAREANMEFNKQKVQNKHHNKRLFVKLPRYT